MQDCCKLRCVRGRGDCFVVYLRVLSVVCVWCQRRDFDGDFSVPLVFLIESLDVAVFDIKCACDSVNGQQCLNY